MKSNTDLYQSIAEGNDYEYLYFWGHSKPKSGTMNKSCFSQWYRGFPFTDGEHTFATAEHYMMWRKAKLFGDDIAAQKCLDSSDPREVKQIGRSVKNYVESEWVNERYKAVFAGNMLKFTQNDLLKEFILGTESKVLVEASPYDNIWGIGMNEQDACKIHPTKWRGANLLGYVLMDVREALS